MELFKLLEEATSSLGFPIVVSFAFMIFTYRLFTDYQTITEKRISDLTIALVEAHQHIAKLEVKVEQLEALAERTR